MLQPLDVSGRLTTTGFPQSIFSRTEKSWKTLFTLQYGNVIDFRAGRYRTWVVCLALVLGTLAVYWPARHYGFVDYDDNDYVFNNPTVRAGLSWWGLVWAFVDQHANNWHPVTWLSHMLDCQLFGLNAGAHHMVNVLFHCANAVLLLLLLNSATGAFWRSAFVAALFAWHPLRVESVVWISERKDVLSGFFFMLTLWMYVLHVKREVVPFPAKPDETPRPKSSSAARRFIFFKLALGFFVLGLLSKPMLVTVPLILLLMDFWPLSRFAGLSQHPSRMKVVKSLLMEKIPFFLFSMIVGVITFFAQRAGGATNAGPHLGFFSRIGEAVIEYLGYLGKIFWPHNLTVLYLRPDSINMGLFFVALLVLIAISILAAANLRRRPCLAVGWIWFLGMLLPVSGLISFGFQSIADRYTYLPSIGFFLMCTWGITELFTALFPPLVRRVLLAFGAAVILPACAGLSRHQLAYWKNTETLMEHAIKINPNNYIAHDDLGVYFSRMGRTKDALFQYQLERELDPGFAHLPEGSQGTNSTQAPASPK
jgi:protein O-mannosyl-transferase